MIARGSSPFGYGYTPITEIEGANASMLMDFGILRLRPGEEWEDEEEKERAFLLMTGSVRVGWGERSKTITRDSLLDQGPWVLHVPPGVAVALEASANAELAVQKVRHDGTFEACLYGPEDCRSERFGEGTMQGTATRVVRTVFDAASAPYSNMVLGEVVNYPGKWSSYPPHHHPQPEVYHYRFSPRGGYGYSEHGEEVFKVHDGDTALIAPRVTHPQTAAPGYAMYYIWMIPHLEDARFGPDSREFVPEHLWLTKPHAAIWPEKEGKR
jgi:5-deoxy-glucuronate isomerase